MKEDIKLKNQIIQYIETMKDINFEAKSYQERRDQLEFVRGYGSALNELLDYINPLTPISSMKKEDKKNWEEEFDKKLDGFLDGITAHKQKKDFIFLEENKKYFQSFVSQLLQEARKEWQNDKCIDIKLPPSSCEREIRELL